MTHPLTTGRSAVSIFVRQERRARIPSAVEDVPDQRRVESEMPLMDARTLIESRQPTRLLLRAAANGSGDLHRLALPEASRRQGRPHRHNRETHERAAFCEGER